MAFTIVRDEERGFYRTRVHHSPLGTMFVSVLIFLVLAMYLWPREHTTPTVDAMDFYPYKGERVGRIPPTITSARPIMTSNFDMGNRLVKYKVSRSETLWEITKRFMSENGLNSHDEEFVSRIGIRAKLLVNGKTVPIDDTRKLRPGDIVVFQKIERKEVK